MTTHREEGPVAAPVPSAATPVAPSNTAYRPGRAVTMVVATQTLKIGAWLWAIVLAVVLGVPLVVDHFGGETGSIYSGVAQGPRWFLFVMALIVLAEGLGPHVALGLTRRSFVRQSAVGLLLPGAVFGIASAAVTFLERWFYGRLGWTLETFYGRHPIPTEPWGLVLVDHAVLLVVFALSGLAVGAVYYRWRGWIGTLALPVTVGPVFIAAAALPYVDATDLAWLLRLDRLPYPAALGVAAVIGVGFWAVARLALRGAAVRLRPDSTS